MGRDKRTHASITSVQPLRATSGPKRGAEPITVVIGGILMVVVVGFEFECVWAVFRVLLQRAIWVFCFGSYIQWHRTERRRC